MENRAIINKMIINLICKTCNKVYEFDSKSVPDNAIAGECNWCPICEDRADDYYTETWYKADGSTICE